MQGRSASHSPPSSLRATSSQSSPNHRWLRVHKGIRGKRLCPIQLEPVITAIAREKLALTYGLSPRQGSEGPTPPGTLLATRQPELL